MSHNTLRIAAALQLLPPDGDAPRRFRMVAYDGGLLRLGGMPCPMVVDLAGVSATNQVKALLHHDPAKPVGHMDHVEIGRQGITADGVLSVPENADEIIRAQANGFEWEASIGAAYESGALEHVPAGRQVSINGRSFRGPIIVVRQANLREISFVGAGAGENTYAALAALQKDPTTMEIDLPDTDDLDGLSADELKALIRELRGKTIEAAAQEDDDKPNAAEAARQVNAIASQLGVDNPALVNVLSAQFGAGSIRRNDVELHLLRASRTGKLAGFVVPGGGGGNPGEISQPVIECALALKAGNERVAATYGERTMHVADKLRRKSLFDMQNMLLASRRMPTFDTIDDMLRAGMIQAGGVSTTSLPVTLGNTANRFLEVAMRETPATWQSFAAIRTAKNFHPHTGIRPSFVGELEEVGPDGEVKSGTMKEALLSWRVDQFAKMFSIDRKTFINDGVGFFDETVPLMAKAAARKLNDLVYHVILANANNHFHTNNGNYLSGEGSDLSVEGLGAAIAQMRTQRDPEGNNLDITPAVLVVAPEQEHAAKALLNSIELRKLVEDTLTYPTGNPVHGAVKLEVEARVSNDKFPNASPTRWYLFAGPVEVPVIVAFLEGQRSPRVEFFGLDHQVSKLAYQWRCYQDFGAALGDPLAGQMSDGDGGGEG